MKESIGSTWSLQIMILFLLIFSAFLIIVLNYSRAYIVKNDVVSIVEKYEGFSEESVEIVNNYLISKGYKGSGRCPEGWRGVENLKDNVVENANGGKEYNYCFVEERKDDRYYTRIKVFFKFNLPAIGDILTYGVNGKTNSYKGYRK